MKQRSPVLGYNHNVRYGGRLWHVQTEDSGVQNPHLFTHLFHDGTILATKRVDYDPASEAVAVQKLMQTQHKAMLRELKSGAFDEKITQYFGAPLSSDPEESTDPQAAPPMEPLESTSEPPTPDSLPAPPRAPAPASRTDPELRPPPMARPPEGSSPVAANRAPPSRPSNRPSLTPSRPAITVTGSRRPNSSTHIPRLAPAPTVTPAATSAATPFGTGRPTAEGVVVVRPTVIVGGDGPSSIWQTAPAYTPAAAESPPAAADGEAGKQPSPDSIFGGDLISEKSLDEVILAYLSEDLNEK